MKKIEFGRIAFATPLPTVDVPGRAPAGATIRQSQVVLAPRYTR
jgi:hypothetical protein